MQKREKNRFRFNSQFQDIGLRSYLRCVSKPIEPGIPTTDLPLNMPWVGKRVTQKPQFSASDQVKVVKVNANTDLVRQAPTSKMIFVDFL